MKELGKKVAGVGLCIGTGAVCAVLHVGFGLMKIGDTMIDTVKGIGKVVASK